MDQPNGLTKIVPLLVTQHQQIRSLLDAVSNATGDGRRGAFENFRRFLAVHEAAEEEAVHPAARTGAGGVVEQRLAEEYEAGQTISKLEDLDPDSEAFEDLFAELKHAVAAHARHEEQQEFPALAEVVDAVSLDRLHHVVRLVEPLGSTPAATDAQPFETQLAQRRQHFRGAATGG